MERQFTGGYYGPATGRTVDQYASEWQITGLGSLDELILDQVTLAQRRGEKRIQIVDIGSEREAVMLSGLIDYPWTLPRVREFMQNTPGMRLELTGLTDARSSSEFGKSLIEYHSIHPDFDASLRVVPYSLSATQSMEDFLKQQKISEIHLATAVWSLPYLGVNTFNEVLTTTSQALTKGGLFVGAAYGEAVSGLGFCMDYDFDPEIIYLKRKKSLLNSYHWAGLLGELPSDQVPEFTEKQITEARKSLIQTLMALGKTNVLDQKTADQLIDKLQVSYAVAELAEVGTQIRYPIWDFWTQRFGLLKEKKDAKIRSLKESSDDFSVTTYPEQHKETIVIRKK